MAEEKDRQQEEEIGTSPPKRRIKWVILAVLILVLSGGGFAAWTYLGKAGGEPGGKWILGGKTAESAKKQPVKVIYPLESFIVNLMEKQGAAKRYLKLTMALELDSDAGKVKAEKNQIQLQDTIIILLSSQGFEEIITLEGKLALKQELLSRVNQILGPGAVSRIYFTEFVVQ
jgi:flagellar protein FliL